MKVCPICGAPDGACRGEVDLVLPPVLFAEAKPIPMTPERAARKARVKAAMERRKAGQ